MGGMVGPDRGSHRDRSVLYTILLVVGVLLFTAALFGIVLSNASLSLRTQRYLASIDAVGRERALIERMTKDVEVLEKGPRLAPFATAQTELNVSIDEFDATLRTLVNGGRIVQSSGQTTALDVMRNLGLLETTRQLQRAWTPLRAQFVALHEAQKHPTVLKVAATIAPDQAADVVNSLNILIKQLASTTSLELERLTILRNLLIFLVVACFVLIVGSLNSRATESQLQVEEFADGLSRRNVDIAAKSREVAESKRGSDVIMETVRQGLLLIDSHYLIQPQFSKEIQSIFHIREIAGYNFLNVLQRILTERMFNTSRDYLTLLFDPSKKERTVLRVNPLDEIEVNFANPEGGFLSKYLSFSFRRIVEEGKIVQVFIAVSDVTDRVQLERQLRESEQKKEQQFELLLGILHVEPRQLADFVATAKDQVQQMNDALRAQDFATASAGQMELLRQRLDVVFRCVHNIKGNASLLRLEYFMRKTELFESKIVELRNRTALGGDDFLAIVIAQADLRTDLDELDDLRAKFTGLQQPGASFSDVNRQGGDEMVESIREFAESLAHEVEKDIRVDTSGFDTRELSDDRRRIVKDVLIQLIRNSMAHGVEAPADRVGLGKPRHAKISIRPVTNVAAGAFGFIYRDDGFGLDPIEIRRKAVEHGLLTAEEAVNCDDSQVAGLIFTPGFSTRTEAGVDAGRGMGMEVIKQHVVDECGGEISVTSEPGRYCEFSFLLPASQPAYR